MLATTLYTLFMNLPNITYPIYCCLHHSSCAWRSHSARRPPNRNWLYKVFARLFVSFLTLLCHLYILMGRASERSNANPDVSGGRVLTFHATQENKTGLPAQRLMCCDLWLLPLCAWLRILFGILYHMDCVLCVCVCAVTAWVSAIEWNSE